MRVGTKRRQLDILSGLGGLLGGLPGKHSGHLYFLTDVILFPDIDTKALIELDIQLEGIDWGRHPKNYF